MKNNEKKARNNMIAQYRRHNSYFFNAICIYPMCSQTSPRLRTMILGQHTGLTEPLIGFFFHLKC